MKKAWKKLSAVLIAATMILAMASTSAADQKYSGLVTNVTNPTTTFDKYLIMDETTIVPNVNFEITLEAVTGNPKLGIGTTTGIVTGVKYNGAEISDTNKITASFTSTSTTYTAVQTGDDITASQLTGKKYAKDSMTLDFSGVAFTEPGIYAYKLTESLSNTGSAAVDGTERYLYVYVEDAGIEGGNNVLDITGYLFTKASDAIDGTGKTTGIINEYPASTLTFGKEVTGNQGSRDKYFKFTVTVSGDNIRENDLYTVDNSRAVTNTTANAATIYETSVMNTANAVTQVTGKQLMEGVDFYLQDGNYITILGIPHGSTYNVAEVEEDYTKENRITIANSSLDWDSSADGVDALSDNPSGTLNSDVHTGFTNSKEGVIPTGVLMSVAPVVIVGLIVVGGIVFFAVRGAKKKASEAAEEDA